MLHQLASKPMFERFVKETRKLDEALACYGEQLHPRLKRCNALRKDLIRAMAPFLDRNRLGQKRDRQTLREIKARGETAVLDRAWVGVHNYLLDGPATPVEHDRGFLRAQTESA